MGLAPHLKRQPYLCSCPDFHLLPSRWPRPPFHPWAHCRNLTVVPSDEVSWNFSSQIYIHYYPAGRGSRQPSLRRIHQGHPPRLHSHLIPCVPSCPQLVPRTQGIDVRYPYTSSIGVACHRISSFSFGMFDICSQEFSVNVPKC
jgi:hypothetical protein